MKTKEIAMYSESSF